MLNSKIISVFIYCLLAAIYCNAQDSSEARFQYAVYAEGYINRSFNNPSNHATAPFLYSHNKTNSPHINIAFLKASYQTKNVRSNIALAAGTYMQANYANENGIARYLYEANMGIKLSKKHDLWFDAGVFSSHIGFESAVGKDAYTLSRSMVADNSPYFETGAKITYTSKNNKYMFSLLALNGWQRIGFVRGNSLLSAGIQVQYRMNEKVLLNYSFFAGNDKPDSVTQLRLYNNFYTIAEFNKKWSLMCGFDIGFEQTINNRKQFNRWLAWSTILRYSINQKWKLAGRFEGFWDKHQVIIASPAGNRFFAKGYSVNADYYLTKNWLCRAEAKLLSSRNNIFYKDNGYANKAFTLGLALIFSR